jgi:hypothetical protein
MTGKVIAMPIAMALPLPGPLPDRRLKKSASERRLLFWLIWFVSFVWLNKIN